MDVPTIVYVFGSISSAIILVLVTVLGILLKRDIKNKQLIQQACVNDVAQLKLDLKKEVDELKDAINEIRLTRQQIYEKIAKEYTKIEFCEKSMEDRGITIEDIKNRLSRLEDLRFSDSA